MANILTAEQLIEERQKATKKQLPSFGSKDFRVTSSEDEKEKISSILSTTRSLLASERVEKSNLLSNADWDKELKLAKVTKKVGKFFETFGHSINGSDYLYPEEALFLLENSNLELFFCGLPVSIQRGYSLLLSADSGCSLNEFRVYSYLSKSGYRVFRHEVTTIAQINKKQIKSSNTVCNRIVVSTEEATSPEDSCVKVSNSGAEISRTICLSKTKITDPPSSCKPPSPHLHRDKEVAARDDVAINEESNRNETTVPVKNTESSVKSQSCLQQRSQNIQINKNVLPVPRNIRKQRKLHRKALFGVIYPSENESLRMPNYDPLRSWRSPQKATPAIRSSSQSEALSRDIEFTRITKQFPVFEKGQFTTSMPSQYYLPGKIQSKYSSTTMNVETGQITHALTPGQIEARLSTQKVVPVKNAPKGNKKFIGKQTPNQPTKKFRTKRQERREIARKNKARRRMEAEVRRAQVFKSENILTPAMRRQEQNNLVNSMQNILNLNEANSSSSNQFAQLPSGPPDLTNSEIARPNPWFANPITQNPFNQQIQVKSELALSANPPVMNLNQMNQPLMNQPFPNEQAPFTNPPNPLNPNILGQMIANVVSQLIPNQINQNFSNQSNPNFLNQPNPNFSNQPMPNFPNQPNPNFSNNMVNPNFPNQLNPNFPNQSNPNFPNQSNPNFPNQGTPNFQNSMSPNTQNSMNPNFPNQMNNNSSNHGNPGFFNQPSSNFGNQNFGSRYPSQRFQRPYNNYGNNNNNVSEVTRHARKMHGMARRMLAVAQAMFKNPEEFTENPENINIYNFSNRFRNPNDQRPWRHPNHMQNFNNNYRNNYRPRFDNNFNSNFGHNSYNSNFGQNFNSNRNDFDNTNSPNQVNNFHQTGDRCDSSRSRNDENNANCAENSNDAPETKFNPNASNDASETSNPAPPGEGDNLFFVDIVGQNPSNLLKTARTIPGSRPTISFADKSKPAQSSSESESSESESDNNDIQVLEPSKKKPEVETVDILSSDEDIVMSISSKVNRSRQTANKICSTFSKNLKTKNTEVIDIDSSSKRRRLDSDAEVITLDDDVTVIDCDPVPSVAQTEIETQDSNTEDSASAESVIDPKDDSASHPPVVKQEKDGGTRIKSESSTEISEPLESQVTFKQEPDAINDNNSQRMETTSESTAALITVKRETCDNENSSIGKTVNETQDSSSTAKHPEDSILNTSVISRMKLEAEEENVDRNVEAGESSSPETDVNDESNSSSTEIPSNEAVPESVEDISGKHSEKTAAVELAPENNEMITEKLIDDTTADESAPKNSEVNSEEHPEKPSADDAAPSTANPEKSSEELPTNERVSDTSSRTVDESSVIENNVQSKEIVSPNANTVSKSGWAALKVAEKKSTEKGNVDKPTTMEVDEQDKNKDLETGRSDGQSCSSEENKPEALLQPHHCKNLGTVLNALQIFKSTTDVPEDLSALKVSFDLYQPKKVFGKASRPDPDYRIIVTGYMDPVPSPVQIDEIKNRYQDNIKILFAVVHPSSISFFFIGNVQLPVQIDDLLF